MIIQTVNAGGIYFLVAKRPLHYRSNIGKQYSMHLRRAQIIFITEKGLAKLSPFLRAWHVHHINHLRHILPEA